MPYAEVKEEHFSAISREPLPHVLIERALLQLGTDGAKFRNDALAAAGWGHSNLTPFSKHPTEACKAFNRIRQVIESLTEPDAILSALRNG